MSGPARSSALSVADRTLCQARHQVDGWMGLPFSLRDSRPSGIEKDSGADSHLLNGKGRPGRTAGFTIAPDFCGRVVWMDHHWFARPGPVRPVLWTGGQALLSSARR